MAWPYLSLQPGPPTTADQTHRMGADTVLRIERKHREVEAELAPWRALAVSTGFVNDLPPTHA